jgi:hypothetical protein
VIDIDINACPPDSLKRLLDTRSKKKERFEAYIEIFFFPTGKPDVVKEATQKYLTMLEKGVSMRQIEAKMMEDRRQSIGNRAEHESTKQRIDDLKKAQAVFLKQKAEKKKKKAAATKLPQGPPCAVCGTTAVGETRRVCSVCDIAFEHGIARETYAWCSSKCQETDLVSCPGLTALPLRPLADSSTQHKHTEQNHDCAAGDGCIQQYGDDLEGDDLVPYFCKDCLEDSTSAAFWCSLKCAEADYYNHRDEAHSYLERPHHDYEAGQVQEGFDARTDALASGDMRLVSVNQVMQDVENRNAMRVSHTLDYVETPQPGPSHHRIADLDTMDGIEMQGADTSGKGKGKEVLRTTEHAANGRYHDTEMTDYATPGAGNRGGDVEMRDADDTRGSQGTDLTRDGPVYVWGDKSPRHRIDPATYKTKEPPGTGGRPGEPLLSPERIDRHMYRRSAEPAGAVERQPAQPASIFSHGPTGTATGRSASAEPPKTLANQPTTTVEVANMGTGVVSTAKKPEEPKNDMAIPSSSRADPGKEARKVAVSVGSQPPRHRNDEQRRYADREPARTEDARKRKQDEARQADRDREYKRARSVASEEKEEGEI